MGGFLEISASPNITTILHSPIQYTKIYHSDKVYNRYSIKIKWIVRQISVNGTAKVTVSSDIGMRPFTPEKREGACCKPALRQSVRNIRITSSRCKEKKSAFILQFPFSMQL